MPKKTARQALDSTLKRLKASVPDSFAPDPASPLHENVQRLLASGLTETNTYDATYRHHQLDGLFVVRQSVDTMRNGQPWIQLLALADPHYGIGIHDLDQEDPSLYRVDFEDGWDEEHSAPRRTSGICRLSELLPKIKKRKVEAKLPELSLAKVQWTGDLPHKPFDMVFASGPDGLLTRGQERWDESKKSADLAQCLGIVAPDGTVESLPYQAEHSNYIGGATWVGEDRVAVLGHRTNVITSVGVAERKDGAWQLRELWSGAPDAEGARRSGGRGVVGAEGVFAFESVESRDAERSMVHIWAEKDGEWAEVKRMDLTGRLQWIDFVSPDRLVVYLHPKSVEFVRDGDDWKLKASKFDYKLGAHLDQGRLVTMDPKGTSVLVFEDGQQVQKLPVGTNHSAKLVAQGGRVVVYATSKTPSAPAKVPGWRHDGTKYTSWLKVADPHPPATGRDFLGFAGDALIAAQRSGGLHRLEV